MVQGLNLNVIDGLEREGDVQWTNMPVQLLGAVDGGVLTMGATVQG